MVPGRLFTIKKMIDVERRAKSKTNA